jgi:hypothetical protein
MPGDNHDALRKPDMMASAVSKSMDPPEAFSEKPRPVPEPPMLRGQSLRKTFEKNPPTARALSSTASIDCESASNLTPPGSRQISNLEKLPLFCDIFADSI